MDILVVDDKDRLTALCQQALPQHRWRGPARSFADAADQVQKARGRIELVLLDVHFDIPPAELVGFEPGLDAAAIERLKRTQGLYILRALRARWPDLPVILTTTREEVSLEQVAGDEEFTYFVDDEYVDARSLGAQLESVGAALRADVSDGPVFWGRTLAMRRVRQRLTVVARGRLPVVLLGPTGTGKSLIARHFVHDKSERKGAFVAVDLATLPRDLMAAHLFGSAKGAYTGSLADRVGAFEAADRGTLFLDEIGNLPPDAQKMLLTVLQDGTVTRLGDVKERHVDVKVVVATNEDLRARVADGTFRADLLMRLNPTAAIVLPPLSERAGDFDALLAFTLGQSLARGYLHGLVDDYRAHNGLGEGRVEIVAGGAVPAPDAGVLFVSFPDRTMRLLRQHHFTGNLREFAMVAENAVLFALSEVLPLEAGGRRDVVAVRPKLVRDLLHDAPAQGPATPEDGTWVKLRLQPQDTLNKVAVDVEVQYFTALYVQHKGDFGAMATTLLGDASHARKVQLRFNQMGLKVKTLRELLVT